jgi:Fic family protein
MSDRTGVWPPHNSEPRAWRQTARAGSREDRMLSEVVVSLPPLIAELHYDLPAAQADAVSDATRQIMLTDLGWGERLGALGRFLLRTESVASSKIEHVEARTEDFARALVGVKSNASATSMVAATKALTDLVDKAVESGGLSVGSILLAHRTLMAEDLTEARFAGRLRPMQNWIGGSDYSPRGADYIPPPPELVAAYLDDLMTYARRRDMPALLQATIVHAQFESIHPFTDGNGRIGRALINAVLRRRGVTTSTVVPIASSIVADTQRYFDALSAYRTGRLEPLVELFAQAAGVAATESRRSAEVLVSLPDEWRAMSSSRAGSTAAVVVVHLLDHPVLTVDSVERMTGASDTASYAAMAHLEADGVVHEITRRKRDRVWAASAVLEELDDLARRIGAAIRRGDQRSLGA